MTFIFVLLQLKYKDKDGLELPDAGEILQAALQEGNKIPSCQKFIIFLNTQPFLVKLSLNVHFAAS